MIEGASKESGEGRNERDGTISARGTDRNTDKILLSDEALDESRRIDSLDFVGESRVLRVAVECDHAIVVLRDFGERGAVSETSSYLLAEFVVRGRVELYVSDVHRWRVVD